MRKCVADIHNSATKIKLVLKNESFSFLDIARFEDKLETEWKHDMLKLSNMPKNQDNDKIIWFIIWSSIKLHGQREFRGLDSTPFVEKVEKKALENFKFCKTSQIGKISPWPKYVCEVDCCIFWCSCFRWLRWWWFAPPWNIFFIRWPGLNRWGLSYKCTTT